MKIPRVDTDMLREIADNTAFEPWKKVILDAAERITLLEDALRVVLQEAIPSGTSGPFMLTRETMSKIAAVWSPGLEALRLISMKAEQNQPLTAEDVAEAMKALEQIKSGEQGGG